MKVFDDVGWWWRLCEIFSVGFGDGAQIDGELFGTISVRDSR